MRRERQKPMADINVVPYIDVMLVLLVIFMVTTPLLTQGVKVSLPQAEAKQLPESQQVPMIVSVDAHGNYFLNVSDHPGDALSEKRLLTLIAAQEKVAQSQGSARPVYVKGDEHVPYGRVVQAMVVLQHAGVPRVGLLTQDPRKSS